MPNSLYKKGVITVNIKKKITSAVAYVAIAVLTVPASAFTIMSQTAHAATLTASYIRLNRMSAGTTTSFRLVFTTVGAGATSVAVNLNGADAGSGWTNQSGVVNATQTVSSASCAAEVSGSTALPGSITAAGSGSTITISSVTALAATTKYCVDLTSATSLTNATAGEYHPTITVGSDSTTTALRTISNDQIVVTATVPPTFNFVLSGNTDSFSANLSTGSVSTTTGQTVTITSNATSGWIAWVKGLNTGLTSAAAAKTINSTTAGTSCASGHGLSAGTEGYGVAATITTDASGGGTVSLDNNYNCGASAAGGIDTTFRQFASSNGTANGDVITIQERAAIAGSTPAANDYTDTLTVIGAGNF